MRAVGLTHTGRERSRNEDSYLVKTGEELSILAVADGMGGHVAGMPPAPWLSVYSNVTG